MPTPYQREALVELKKRGFKPEGYKSNGYMLLSHPSGYKTDLASTPSDHKSLINKLKKVDRELRLQKEARVQFLHWLWKKWGVEPGESIRCSFTLADEVRLFQNETEIYKRTSTQSIAVWVTNQKWFKNEDPKARGRGKRTWIISRPPEEEVAKPVEEEVLAEFSSNGNGHQPVPAPAVEAEPVAPAIPNMAAAIDEAYQTAYREAVEKETASEKAVRLSQVDPDNPDHATELDPQLIQRLSDAFTQPFQAELNEKNERLSFVKGELDNVEAQLVSALEILQGLRQLIEG